MEEAIANLIYFYPGLTYDDAWGISPKQRDTISTVVSKRLKEKHGIEDGII